MKEEKEFMCGNPDSLFKGKNDEGETICGEVLENGWYCHRCGTECFNRIELEDVTFDPEEK